jgi:hypothetical protein
MIMSILNELMKMGAKVWTIKDNYRLGQDSVKSVGICVLAVGGDRAGLNIATD